MKKDYLEIIKENIESEPYVILFGIKVLELKKGYSLVQMKAKKNYDNIFSITHGGAIFSLVDVAFGSAANSYGTVAVALNVSINYMKSVLAGDTLTAEATEISRGRKIATYNIIVRNGSNKINAPVEDYKVIILK